MLEKRKANTDTTYFTTKFVKNNSNIARSAQPSEWEENKVMNNGEK